MDKRYLLAFLVSFLILIFYPHYLKLINPSHYEQKSYKESPVAATRPPSPISAPEKPKEGAASYTLRKGPFEIVFSSRGGTILSLEQNGSVFFDAGPAGEGIFGMRLLNESEDLSAEIFTTRALGGTEKTPSLTYEKSGEYRVTKRFFLGSEKPSLVLEVELENLSARERTLTPEIHYGLGEHKLHPSDELGVKMVRSSADEIRATDLRSLRKNTSVTSEPLEWHGLLRKYEALLVKSDAKILGQETEVKGPNLMSRLTLSPVTLSPGGKRTVYILIYAGPQRYETLKEFGVGFEKILTQGTLGQIRLWLLAGLNFFYRLTKNYGAAILIVTLLIKLLFTPLTHFSYQSMSKMQALQPKIKALQKQFKNDAQRLNKEMMGLYRRNRVNPLGGCLPMVLQIPIFIAFYQVLSEAVDLKGAPFILWIRDLSEPDRLFNWPVDLPFVGSSFNLLPILMIGSMLWQQRLTPQTASTPEQEKIMYLMPVIFGFVFYNLPSGLVLYWFINNLLTIFHQLVIKRIPVILHHEDQ